jgi:hypothetical protein
LARGVADAATCATVTLPSRRSGRALAGSPDASRPRRRRRVACLPEYDMSLARLLSADADWVYDKLEQVIMPLHFANRDRLIRVMRMAIALNGSFFHAEHMIDQHVTNAYVG